MPVTALAGTASTLLPEPSPSVCAPVTRRYCPVILHRGATRRRCPVDVCAGPVWGAGLGSPARLCPRRPCPGRLGCRLPPRRTWGASPTGSPSPSRPPGSPRPVTLRVSAAPYGPVSGDGDGDGDGDGHGVVGLGFLVQRIFGRPNWPVDPTMAKDAASVPPIG